VHPYKLIGNVCRALATSDWGHDFLNKHIYIEEGRKASGVSFRSDQRPREARIADMIASLAGSPEGCTHLRDCVLKGKDNLFWMESRGMGNDRCNLREWRFVES
jgi:hypothetical protein